jgi:hypothetical protein
MCLIADPIGRAVLRRGSAAARLLKLSVRIPPGARMCVSCECCVLQGRGLCDELITHPEDSYRLWCFVVCDLETSKMRKPWPPLGHSATGKDKCVSLVISLKDWLAASRFGLRHLWKSKPTCSPDLTMQIAAISVQNMLAQNLKNMQPIYDPPTVGPYVVA